MITDQERTILISQDDLTLAEWWCALNRWEWPKELPDPESAEYIPGGRRGKFMDWIIEVVGHRFCSRVWNKDMTEREHDDFWNQGTDPAAKERYMEWVSRKVAVLTRLYSHEFDAPLL